MIGEFERNQIYHMNCLNGLKQIPDNCIDLAITSPPYWGQRGDKGIGLEEDPREYIKNLTQILIEVMRVIKPTGMLGVDSKLGIVLKL